MMPLRSWAGGGSQVRTIEVEDMAIAPKLMGDPVGAETETQVYSRKK